MNEESDVIESIIIISMTLMDVREGIRLRITIHGAWCMVDTSWYLWCRRAAKTSGRI